MCFALTRLPEGTVERVRDKLRVLLIDEHADRARTLAQTLERAGCIVVAQLVGPVDLHAALQASRPDMIIVDMDSPDRDTLEDMRRINAENPRPIVMFVEEEDAASIRSAVQAGVAAYVVKGANPERIRPVLDVACARFEEYQALRSELDRMRTTLADRKSVDRAKGILMTKRGMNENEAYRTLQKMAMDQGKRLGEVARHVISVADLI